MNLTVAERRKRPRTSYLASSIAVLAGIIASAGLLAPAAAKNVASPPGSATRPTKPAQPTKPARPTKPPRPTQTGHRALIARSELSAAARAKATGRPQIVAAATTPVSQTTALPNGRLRMTTYVLPVRVKVAGRWQAINPDLRRDRAGTLRPLATSSPVTLSGGGIGPLAVLHGQARSQIALSWPKPLPTPVISGSSAIYRSVAPGADLRVTVTGLGGITLAMTLRNAAAADSSLVRNLRFRLAADGLALATDHAGNLTATNRSRQPVFSASAPVMWSAAPKRTQTRPDKARPDKISAHLAGDSLVLRPTPSSGRASYPATVWTSMTPDASASCSTGPGIACVNRSGFDETQAGCSGAQNYNQPQADPQEPNVSSLDGNLAGNNFWDSCVGANHAYYVMDTSSLNSNMRIISATLQGEQTGSADGACNPTYTWPVNLYDLGRGNQLNANTDWSNQPSLPSSAYKNIGVKPVQYGNSKCDNEDFSFDVWQAIVNAKAGNFDYWTFALDGKEGGSYNGSCDPNATNNVANCGLMRIGDNPYVVVNFDVAPAAPTIDSNGDTMPVAYDTPPEIHGGTTELGCSGTTGWIDSTSVNLRVDVAAPTISGEPVWAYYNLSDITPGQADQPQQPTMETANNYPTGGYTNTPIPFALVNGHVYSWQSYAMVNGVGGNSNGTGEGSLGPFNSGLSPACRFGIDTTSPVDQAVTSSSFPPPGGGPAAFAGTTGTFNISAYDLPAPGCNPAPADCTTSGMWGFAYSLNHSDFTPNASNTVKETGTNGPEFGSASISLTPGLWGINNLYVEAIDNAGNVSSQPFDYTFYARWNPADGPTPGDVSSDQVPDLLATTKSGGLSLYKGPITSTWPTLINATGNLGSPDSQNDWNTFDITHRGSLSHFGVDDLFAIQPGQSVLYLYENDPSNSGADAYGNTGGVIPYSARPACNSDPDNSANCTQYPGSDKWAGVASIVAPGDAWTGAPANSDTQNCTTTSKINCDFGDPSLITAESNGQLWIYQGQNGDALANPVQLGSTGWNNMTLLAPGVINDQLTLWARNNTTGVIYSYPIYLSSNDVPTLNPRSPGTPIAATSGTTTLGITLKASAYPDLATTGDANTPNGPALYAIDSSGNVFVYPGTPSGLPNSAATKLTTITPGSISELS
jgi:hypothetical protein